MNYVTTNIRLTEDEYLKLKAEAAKRRKSLAAIIREKISSKEAVGASIDVEKIISDLDILAKQNGNKLKGKSGVNIIRDLRDNAKW